MAELIGCCPSGKPSGSGTGELGGISGTGGFQSSGETTTYTLDYTLDNQPG